MSKPDLLIFFIAGDVKGDAVPLGGGLEPAAGSSGELEGLAPHNKKGLA